MLLNSIIQKTMRWVDFVKRYSEENNLSYKKALSAASGPFKTHKKKQKYTEPKLKRRKKKDKPAHEDCSHHIIENIPKRLSDKVKKECGIMEKRKSNVPPKTRKTKLMSGSSKRRTVKRAKPKRKPKQ